LCLFGPYNFILKKYHPDVLTVVLKDHARNILNRLTFYDEDTKLIETEVVNDRNREAYYRDIKADIAYFYDSYRRAKLQFHINGMNVDDATRTLAACINVYTGACMAVAGCPPR
jgi:shikimate kinase